MISPGHLLISTVPITADKFIPAALSRGFDVAAANVPLRENCAFAYAGRRDACDKTHFTKLSGVTPAGFFFAGYGIMMPIVVLKSHGCEAVAAERADRMRVNFCAFAQKPKQQKLRGRAEVEQ